MTWYKVGDIGPAGGYIFYADAAGFVVGDVTYHYLEAAPTDLEGTYQWGGSGTSCSTGTAIGTGITNTAELVTHDHGTPSSGGSGLHLAARACADFSMINNNMTYSDWFLPSKKELALIYCTLKIAGLGVWSGTYWSSSDAPNYDTYNPKYYAWGHRFDDDSQYGYFKWSAYSVRAVRAFSH
jgi:hypothetical protein